MKPSGPLLTTSLVLLMFLAAGEARANRRGVLGQGLRTRLEDLAARPESGKIRLLVRLRDPGLAAAAPFAAGEEWGRLSHQARTDLRRRSSAHMARGLSEELPHAGEHLWIVNSVSLEVTPDEALALAENGRVEQVLEDVRVRCLPAPETLAEPTGEDPDGPAGPGKTPWGLLQSGIRKAQKEFGLDGSGVLLGHVDTGAEATHPALKGRIAGFRDFTGGSSEAAYDDHGHGTHTLGVMVGGGARSSAAPGATALVARALDEDGTGQLSHLLKSLQWMVDPDGDPATRDQPFAVNASWGIPRRELKEAGVPETFFWDAVQAMRDAGVVPIFASGNDGPGAELVPGGYPHVLSVGAHDRQGRIPTFSTGGLIDWNGEQFMRPDLVAPGVGIPSAFPGGKSKTLKGTSQAAPHVAGLAALMKQAKPEIRAEEVEAFLKETARDRGKPGPDNRYGLGTLDGYAAVLKAKGQEPPPPPTVKPPPPPPPKPPKPDKKRRKVRSKVVGFVTGIALALGLGLLFMKG